MHSKKMSSGKSNSWQNDPRPVVFGDSLADIGNAKDAAGNPIRQSDGLVLIEALLQDFGIQPQASVASFAATAPTAFKSPLNYAFVGATTGVDGSEARGVGLGGVPVGLLSQIDRFTAENPPKNERKGREGQDAVIAAGANDILEFLDKVALGQTDPRNPQVLAQLIDTITGQTIQAAKTLDDYFDDVIILPSPPLSKTPLLQAIDPSSRGLGALADFLAMTVFNGLKNEFDNGVSARDDIFVVDSFKVFDTATAHFIKDKGSMDGFWFNLVHPSSLANTDYLSDAIADQLNVENSLNPRFSFA